MNEKSFDPEKPLQILWNGRWHDLEFYRRNSGPEVHACVFTPEDGITRCVRTDSGFHIRNAPEKRTVPESWEGYRDGYLMARFDFKPTETHIKTHGLDTILHYPAREYEVGEGL